MKIARFHENYKKEYYEIDIITFEKKVKKFFYIEFEKGDMQSEFFKKLKDLCFVENVSTLNSTIVLIIKNILQDKEIEFVSEPLGVKHNSEEYFGRVKTIFFRVKFLSDANKYMMDVKLYEQNQSEEMIRVDCAKPIKVYSKPTEFEEYLEFLDSASKFNL